MKELDIRTIMNQLGFLPFQVERWHQMEQKLISQSPEFASAPIDNCPAPPSVHNTPIFAASEPIGV
jgi:hypothetical protein